MKVEFKKEFTSNAALVAYNITLTEEEALWLKAYMKKPICAHEDSRTKAYRKNIFNSISIVEDLSNKSKG